MSHKRPVQISLVATMQSLPQDHQDRLDDVLATLDDLHTAASEGTLTDFTRMNDREVINWLRDVIYTAQEAIDELESHDGNTQQNQPMLRIVEKIERAG